MPPRLHVLLVDDNPADVFLAREALAGYSDVVDLTTCRFGAEALTWLRAPDVSRPDLVLLDINMPGLTGFDVLSAIEADPDLMTIPVVMLSASTAPADVGRAYSLRASAYVSKADTFPVFSRQMDALVGFWTECRVVGKPLRAVRSAPLMS